ncbi:MAG: DUF2975 domain-containing protein [Tetrasphaera sp.]|nr:DUF2975 domain-containing protein [Tetrasphaera sp.]
MDNTTSRSTRSACGIVEAVIWLVMIAALLTGLGYVIGPNGLGLIHGKIRWPFIGNSQYEMSVETPLDTAVTITGAPTMCHSLDGSVDCATGRPPVEVGHPVTATVQFPRPTTTQRWLWVLGLAAGPVVAAVCLWLILRMLRSARHGDPFTRENLRRMQWLAILVGIDGSLVTWSGAFLDRWLLDTSAAEKIVAMTFDFSFLPAIGGLLIGVLAEVWRRGMAMREDLDGLV